MDDDTWWEMYATALTGWVCFELVLEAKPSGAGERGCQDGDIHDSHFERHGRRRSHGTGSNLPSVRNLERPWQRPSPGIMQAIMN